MELSIIYITYRPGGFDILADSLQNQMFKDYELIIVDDCKIDRRDKVRRYLEEKGMAVAYVGPSKPKCFPDIAFNVSNAINTGFLLSTKEVVVLLQDYQWLPPDCLEKFAGHDKLFKGNHCVVLPGQMWDGPRPRNNKGLISIWSHHWKGSPEENGCQKSFTWVPEGWEFSCIAFPWKVVASMNGFPECLDAYAAHLLEPLVKRFEEAGGKPYVDKDNFIQVVNHREWPPHELWHQAKRKPKGSTVYIERENCFDLKKHVRGSAYWLEEKGRGLTLPSLEGKIRESGLITTPEGAGELPLPSSITDYNIFNSPDYWCGNLGYRPPGYTNFEINSIKTNYILERKPKTVLDIGCAYGYIVKRLRDKGIDAWGLDCSEFALSHAPNDVKPFLKLGSADSLPFGDKEFDMVVSFSTFEHLPKGIVEKAIKEVARVAKRGIIAVTPSSDPHFDEDITHKTKQSLSWWASQFPPQFEVRNDANEQWLKKTPEAYMHRIDWIRSKVTMEDKILEVGVAENPVWGNTKFNVTTLDQQINPELKIFPDVQGEAENLPFKENDFDIVCEGELLEHIPDPQKVLREAVRVAKKKVIITVPLEYEWTPELKPFWNPGHVRFYNPNTLEEELKALDLPFKIERIKHGDWAWLGAEIHCAGEREEVVAAEMVKLNLGSFVDVILGWINIDILDLRRYIPAEIKFRQWDLRQGIPYPDNSVDLIRCSHLIEHITLEEAHKLCRECYRVLKPGGFLRVLTPDARIIVTHYANRDMSYFNQIQPPEYIQAPTEGERLSRILFGGDYGHKAVYDFAMLKDFLHQAGFETGKVYLVGADFSWSPTMAQETRDQHIEVSIIVEALK